MYELSPPAVYVLDRALADTRSAQRVERMLMALGLDLASVLRSKNAGPFELTLDILFKDEKTYLLVKNSGVLDRELVSRLYRVPLEDVHPVVFFDPALGVKVTLKRPVASGAIGDTDLYGAQQHAPLMDVKIPIREDLRGEA